MERTSLSNRGFHSSSCTFLHNHAAANPSRNCRSKHPTGPVVVHPRPGSGLGFRSTLVSPARKLAPTQPSLFSHFPRETVPAQASTCFLTQTPRLFPLASNARVGFPRRYRELCFLCINRPYPSQGMRRGKMVSVSGKVGPRTTPPLGCTRYRDNLLQDQALSLDDNSLSANLGPFREVFLGDLALIE